MNKSFVTWVWENYPSENTAVNAERLNQMNTAIDTVDNRVINLDSTKLDKNTAYTMVRDVSYNETTGIFTITKLNGSTVTIDTKLEKLAINWKFDKDKQQLIIILDDGTEQTVDLSALITQYEFKESDTIILSVDADGKVYGTIKKGSITGDMLEPNYLANVTKEADTATKKAAEAFTSASNAKTSENNAKSSATSAASSASEADTSAKEALDSKIQASTSENNAKSSATSAANSATSAKTSETNAKKSETNAKTSETNAASSADTASTKATAAASSATNAATSETNAKASEKNAASSASTASSKASAAATSETNASKSATAAASSATTASEKASAAATSATNAASSATSASSSASSASTSKTNAASSATAAASSASAAATSATQASNYAIGNTNSAKYYYEQAKSISESFAGALRPMGTVTFANLPAISTATEGDMYNVANEFTTTSDFKEGAGNVVPAGTNVYKTADGKWDILAGTPVTGVKGNAESSYRRGNVNITPANIGLGNVPNVSTNDQTPTFSQASNRTNISSGEKLSSIFGKIMKWFADLKTVAFSGSYNDLSNKPTIGNGTITVKQNGTSKGTFTTNQTGNTTIELTDNNTHYTTRLYAGASGAASNASATNPYIKITDDNTYRNQIRLVGSGATTVTSDASGNVTIKSTDTNTWRGIQNNLTSTSTTDSLSAYQGKVLNEKFNSYVPLNPHIQTKTFYFSTAEELSAGWKGLVDIYEFTTYPISFTMHVCQGADYSSCVTINGNTGSYDNLHLMSDTGDCRDLPIISVGLAKIYNSEEKGVLCVDVSSDDPFYIILETYEADRQNVDMEAASISEVDNSKIYVQKPIVNGTDDWWWCDGILGNINDDSLIIFDIDALAPDYGNSTMALGRSDARWSCLYSDSSTIITSDRNKKKDIMPLESGEVESFIMGLKPSTFKYIDGTSNRTHYGMIAQDVEELIDSLGMSSLDFAGFIKSPKTVTVDSGKRGKKVTKEVEGEYVYSLRYEEFIAPLIKMVQIQQNRIEKLEKEIEKIKQGEMQDEQNSISEWN